MPALDPLDLPVTALAEAVRRGETTATAAVVAALDRIASRNPALNAVVACDADLALAQAADLDAARDRGEPLGALAGVAVAVKDTEDTQGYRTTYGSRLWADAEPAAADSVLVARLRAAGCIVVGKTNVPELACDADTDNLVFGRTRNPVAPGFVAGGSSGGAAAAVAEGLVRLATASDGGGSIRIPASVCGLPGFKASLGRIPDGGPQAVDWPSVTTRGVLTPTVDELIAVLDVIVGAHPSEPRSLPSPPVPWRRAVSEQPRPRRIGWSPLLGFDGADREILAACTATVERLAADGIEVVDVPAVFDRDPFPVWVTLVRAYVRRSVGDRDRALLTPSVRDDLELADRLTAAELIAAEDACHALSLQLAQVFETCDLLLTPTLHTDPPRIGETKSWIRALGGFNLTRSPAATMPVGRSTAGVPIGLQIVGPQHGDVAVLALMRDLERLIPLSPLFVPLSPLFVP